MIIRDVVCAPAKAGYFNKDLVAIKLGPAADGFAYAGPPASPGFRQIIQPGQAISVMLVLEDGQVAFGDCVDVIFAGLAGRDRVFRAAEHLPLLQGELREMLRGRRCRPLRSARRRARAVPDHHGAPLHTAVRYGVSQALLHAAALARHVTMAEVVAAEYGCPCRTGPCRCSPPASPMTTSRSTA